MWIVMKETYAGVLGCFPKGHKLNLPPETIKQLPKGSFKRCKAPWDEGKKTNEAKTGTTKTEGR